VRPGRDLDGIPVFYERWSAGCESLFDYELDYMAKQKLVNGAALPGICNVGGTPDTFTLHGDNYREGLRATGSGSSGRLRALAAALSRAVFGDPFSSLPQSCAELRARGARVFLAEASGPLHEALAAGLGDLLTASEYFGADHASGTTVGGRRHEDLQRLSFADAQFDLIVTTDVMEHVADAPAAEREIVRVLRPGGWYLFTIPFYFTLDRDRVRAAVGAGGKIVHHEPPEYHGDPVRPDEGVLVFRDFAEADLRARFTALGCSFEIVRLWSRWLGILGGDMIVMAVRRAESDGP
jgi:SAM-dependent methyltransferase